MQRGVDQYLDLFISESREILSALNRLLVALEQQPENLDQLNEVFRQTHTFKGMAATMGFDDMISLAHEMESVLEQLRRGQITAEKSILDTLFECCDVLEFLVDHMGTDEKQNDSSPSTKASVERVQSVLGQLQLVNETGTLTEQESGKERRSNLRLEQEDREELLKEIENGAAVYRVTVSLSKNCLLKEPRALIVVKALEEIGRVVRSAFLFQQLKSGKFGRHFGLFLVTGQPAEVIKTAIEEIPDVDEVTLSPLASDEIQIDVPAAAAADVAPTTDSAQESVSTTREVQAVRVAVDQLDHFANLIGELVINKIRLQRIAGELDHKPLDEALDQAGRLTDELQNTMMQIRLVPVDYIFNRFPRMARDLASQEKKKIHLVVEGGEVGLDRSILDEIHEPLVHLIRNAVSHGIESGTSRKKQGKPATGTIRLSARRIRNEVEIKVSDDGQGMDLDLIRGTAVRQGIVTSEDVERLEDTDTLMLITAPGFSTAASVTETSGRGMGMSSVRTKVESLGGSLQIASDPTTGSTFALTLPVSMAILQALLVRIAHQTYAIPLINIIEVMTFETDSIKRIEQHEVVSYRDTVLPLVRLRDEFGFSNGKEQAPDAQHIGLLQAAIVESGNRRAGLVVDELIGQQEIVIKMLSEALKRMRGVSGATILGDGRVAMIVDVPSLI